MGEVTVYVELVGFVNDEVRLNGVVIDAPAQVLCMYSAEGMAAGQVLIFN